ncbi:MAG: dTDP-4-dehydrorhamnose 3,5-epimerase family protein [Chloroflexota bacterium]
MSDVGTEKAAWVGAAYREQAWTQEYGPAATIDGVRLIDLRHFSDEGGDFCELARFGPGGVVEGLPGYHIAQISYSLMEPGAIKAWHVHQHQDDVWFAMPAERLLVGLLDVREASPTYRRTMRFVLGAGRARLLFIPRGVAHGAANLGARPASIVYLMNQTFDPDRPDEHRLPYDALGAAFWSIHPG